jgi:hypothetical protein
MMMTVTDFIFSESQALIFHRLAGYEQELLRRTTEQIEFEKMGEKTTICLLTLRNKFEAVGTSACVDASQYDYNEGCFWALKQALNKVDELDGYMRHYNTKE